MKIDGLFLHVFSHIRVKAKVAQCQIYQGHTEKSIYILITENIGSVIYNN